MPKELTAPELRFVNLRGQRLVTHSEGSAEELLGLPQTIRSAVGWPAIHPDDVNQLIALVERATAEASDLVTEFRFTRPDTGAMRWLEVHARVICDPPGRASKLVGEIFDVTAHHEAEAALRECEERFRAFVTASSDVVYRMSPDWREMRYLAGRDFIADTPGPSQA